MDNEEAPALKVQRHVFDSESPDNGSLKMVANQYVNPRPQHGGLTLILTHCIGAHKEQWEPVIRQLIQLQSRKHASCRVKEAWAFDWQSHGDSAILNREALKTRTHPVSVLDLTTAIKAFILSPRMRGHRIVAIGHSAGAAAILLTTQNIRDPPLSALVLVEPTIVPKQVFESEIEDRMAEMDFVVGATLTRREVWNSKSQAFNYFAKRLPWALWDTKVIQLLVDYGLEQLSSGEVCLKCRKADEAASYPDTAPHFEGARQLGKICGSIPVHLIWGERNDLVPSFIQESLSDGSEGRRVASISRVENAGHFVVQERPKELAIALSAILDTVNARASVANPRL